MTDTTPTVTFTITKFHPIGGTHSRCHYTMALANGGTAVALNGDTLTVKEPTDLILQASSGYLVVGMSFKQTDGSHKDPVGAQAFPDATITLDAGSGDPSSTLTLNDLDPSDDSCSYELSLLIERVSDQAMSLLDPPIANEPN